jgi:hypothetical protein
LLEHCICKHCTEIKLKTDEELQPHYPLVNKTKLFWHLLH